MGFRFRRRVRLAKGLNLNLGLKSIGLSLGRRGAHISTNSRGGSRATVGIPSTGLSYTTRIGEGRSRVPPVGVGVIVGICAALILIGLWPLIAAGIAVLAVLGWLRGRGRVG